MKTYTRKQFENRSIDLRRMRRQDPIQFDVLYREYCRMRNFYPTTSAAQRNKV